MSRKSAGGSASKPIITCRIGTRISIELEYTDQGWQGTSEMHLVCDQGHADISYNVTAPKLTAKTAANLALHRLFARVLDPLSKPSIFDADQVDTPRKSKA